MIDLERRNEIEIKREKARRRMHSTVDPENYEYFPATKAPKDYYDLEGPQRVAIYARVSTQDVSQTTSFELQKKYYEDYVNKHENWTLVEIYADEGISGTSTEHRPAFKRMIVDCKNGLIDVIITKSVSRFARNVMTTIGITRELEDLKPPIGVYFESEGIFSLTKDTQLPLTFLATIAENESRIRSRSMETSLRMRLDNGIPLTPKLLGYTHDEDGNLIINEDEAPTVKLIFYMYLYGYSAQQIANVLRALQRKSYLGNTNKWSSSTVIEILRNERHCGDVRTRKTFTKDFCSHKKLKNRGEKPQSNYKNHHEAIVSRDDYIAVQHMLDNAKYGNKSCLPELRIIDSGLLKGYININPKWAGFNEMDYITAARSLYQNLDDVPSQPTQFEVAKGDFDLRGFEITRSQFFDTVNHPMITFTDNTILLNSECTKKLKDRNYVELLINPIERKLAVRTTDSTNRHGFYCSKLKGGIYCSKGLPSTPFKDTIFSLLGWNKRYKYRIIGNVIEQGNDIVYIFEAENSEAYLNRQMINISDDGESETLNPLTAVGNSVRAIPGSWTENFGKDFYLHEQPIKELLAQSEADWQLRLQGKLYDTGKTLKVTPFEELKAYIEQELKDIDLGGEENV